MAEFDQRPSRERRGGQQRGDQGAEEDGVPSGEINNRVAPSRGYLFNFSPSAPEILIFTLVVGTIPGPWRNDAPFSPTGTPAGEAGRKSLGKMHRMRATGSGRRSARMLSELLLTRSGSLYGTRSRSTYFLVTIHFRGARYSLYRALPLLESGYRRGILRRLG